MKLAIIGASGLLGGHLIEKALENHHEVLAVARRFPARSAAHYYKEKITLAALDAKNNLTPSHLEGCDVLINAAAIVSAAQDPSLVEENLDLVKSVFSSAEQAGVSKLVHISSISTMADGTGDKLVTESDFGRFRKTYYAESKYQSDLWLSNNVDNLLTIHPCYMLGKWDSKPSSGAILLALQMGRLKGYLPGTKNFVHAGDVASGILKALEKKVTGRFILGGNNYDLKMFFEKALESLKVEKNLQVMTSLDLEENPPLKEFFLADPVDDSKARREWGYHPKHQLDEMLNETIAYFRDNKLLPRTKTTS